MDDLVKSLKAHLYDRAVSPLFASFAISWIGFNHRLIAVMLSSMPVEKKFAYIDNVLYPNYWAILPTVVLPLVSALALIFLYPIPARYVFKHVRSEQKALKKIQQAIEDETPITQEEAVELRAALRKAKREFEIEISIREVAIENLKKDLELAEREKETAEYFDFELDLNQAQALSAISAEGNIPKHALYDRLDLDRIGFEHLIDELKRFKYVKEWSENDLPFLESTAEGRAYLIRNRHLRNEQAASLE